MIGKSLNTVAFSAFLHFLGLFGQKVWGFNQLNDISIWLICVLRWRDVFWWVRIIRVTVLSPWHENGILGAVTIGQVFLHCHFCCMACISNWGQKNDFYLNTFVDIRKNLETRGFYLDQIKKKKKTNSVWLENERTFHFFGESLLGTDVCVSVVVV